MSKRGSTKVPIHAVVAAVHESRGLLFHAAKRLGISRSSIRNYAARHASVREAIEDERGRLGDAAELVLAKAVKAGEPWAVMFYLRTQGKSRGYTERIEVLSDEQLDSMLAAELAKGD